jgi:hypothetical protein
MMSSEVSDTVVTLQSRLPNFRNLTETYQHETHCIKQAHLDAPVPEISPMGHGMIDMLQKLAPPLPSPFR